MKKGLLKMVVLSMLVALGVVISPILRVEGMCPMAHFINIVCSVFLGPWYSLLCATLIATDIQPAEKPEDDIVYFN